MIPLLTVLRSLLQESQQLLEKFEICLEYFRMFRFPVIQIGINSRTLAGRPALVLLLKKKFHPVCPFPSQYPVLLALFSSQNSALLANFSVRIQLPFTPVHSHLSYIYIFKNIFLIFSSLKLFPSLLLYFYFYFIFLLVALPFQFY